MDNSFNNLLMGVVCLCGTIYYGGKTIHAGLKLRKHRESLHILEKNDKQYDDVDSLLNNNDLKSLNNQLVFLKGKAFHKLIDERKAMGIKITPDYKNLDLFVKTTEYSHGFK